MSDLGIPVEICDENALKIIRGFVDNNCVPSPENVAVLDQTDLVLLSGQFVGAGKSTFIQELERRGRINIASWTNRELRPGEIEGVDKCVRSLGQLTTAAENGDLLELKEVREGIFYATPAKLSPNSRYVKDLELKGALRLRKYAPELSIVVPIPPLHEVKAGGVLTEWERRIVLREGFQKAISDKDIQDLQGRLEGVAEEVNRIYDEALISDPNTAIIVNDSLSIALNSMNKFLATGDKPQYLSELGGLLRSFRLAGHLHRLKDVAVVALAA